MNTAIVGWGHIPFGRREEDVESMLLEVTREALESAGVGACSRWGAGSHPTSGNEGAGIWSLSNVRVGCSGGLRQVVRMFETVVLLFSVALHGSNEYK